MKRRFFETIRIEDGHVFHLDYHTKRLHTTIFEHFGIHSSIDLQKFIEPPKSGVYRCKVIYTDRIENISYFPYERRAICSLRCIEANWLEYPYKYLDREAIDMLFLQRGESDDILIVKEGLITDTSIANVALFDGEKWWTPKTPLLPGTTRQRLLEEGRIYPKDIPVNTLGSFRKIALLNAMIGFHILKECIIA